MRKGKTIYRIYSSRRASYKPSQAFLEWNFREKILYSNNLVKSVSILVKVQPSKIVKWYKVNRLLTKRFCTKLCPKTSFSMYLCELVHTLHVVVKDIFKVSMSHYNRLFRFLPHQKILYSNNIINPVGTLNIGDDLIFKYSSTRINTVYHLLHQLTKAHTVHWKWRDFFG